MRTEQELQTNYSISENHTDDFDARQHLEDLVIQKFEKVKPDVEGKHFYSLNITKTPTRIDYHLFSFDRLQEISRKLTNGVTSLGSVTNRMFWNKYFIGGVRTISVNQNEINEYPSFTLDYLVYSDFDNLDVRIIKNLSIRLKSIDPTLTFRLEYIGKYSPSLVTNHIPKNSNYEFDLPTIYKLGKETVEHIYDNQYQRPRFFGKLFKSNLTK